MKKITEIIQGISTKMPFQTKDNSISEENKEQNKKLTQELGIRIINLLKWNEDMSILQIMYHIQDWEYRNNNAIISKQQARKQATETFYRYKSCGYITEWNKIREDLKKYIEI